LKIYVTHRLKRVKGQPKNLEEKDEWHVMELRAKAPAGLAGARLQNLLLFELQEEDHVNNVVTPGVVSGYGTRPGQTGDARRPGWPHGFCLHRTRRKDRMKKDPS